MLDDYRTTDWAPCCWSSWPSLPQPTAFTPSCCTCCGRTSNVVDPLRELGALIVAEEPGVARIEIVLPVAKPTLSSGGHGLLRAIAAPLGGPGTGQSGGTQ